MRLREGVGSDDKWCLGEESGRKRRLREVVRPREAIPGGGGWRIVGKRSDCDGKWTLKKKQGWKKERGRDGIKTVG